MPPDHDPAAPGAVASDAAAAAPRISVIIPHYHDLPGLDACLAALGRQTYPPADVEIVVADNNSPEGEAAVAGVVAGRARLVVVREQGAGPARNGAVAVSRGEVLAFTDADCRPEPAWLAEGLKALASAPVVGGRMTVLVDDERSMTATEAYERVFGFDNEAYVLRQNYSVTANMFCPRTVFDQVGPFRAGVSEDIDWGWRATGAGISLAYAPNAVVGHPARRNWRDLIRKTRRINAELRALGAEKPGADARWLLRCLALPLSAVAHTPKVLTSPALNTLDQRLAALAMLYRLRIWRAQDCLGLLLARTRTPIVERA
jgi:GT2 family glycosyltransferase